ncbi:uncharacterized protein LOC135827381 [Sycon ciliatum]|uniref:uncharacterized protein LOC135827381 n=1 Tax=Sycon ciliatum TaxID=27933 RepID=UPI0031F5FF0D
MCGCSTCTVYSRGDCHHLSGRLVNEEHKMGSRPNRTGISSLVPLVLIVASCEATAVPTVTEPSTRSTPAEHEDTSSATIFVSSPLTSDVIPEGQCGETLEYACGSVNAALLSAGLQHRTWISRSSSFTFSLAGRPEHGCVVPIGQVVDVERHHADHNITLHVEFRGDTSLGCSRVVLEYSVVSHLSFQITGGTFRLLVSSILFRPKYSTKFDISSFSVVGLKLFKARVASVSIDNCTFELSPSRRILSVNTRISPNVSLSVSILNTYAKGYFSSANSFVSNTIGIETDVSVVDQTYVEIHNFNASDLVSTEPSFNVIKIEIPNVRRLLFNMTNCYFLRINADTAVFLELKDVGEFISPEMNPNSVNEVVIDSTIFENCSVRLAPLALDGIQNTLIANTSFLNTLCTSVPVSGGIAWKYTRLTRQPSNGGSAPILRVENSTFTGALISNANPLPNMVFFGFSRGKAFALAVLEMSSSRGDNSGQRMDFLDCQFDMTSSHKHVGSADYPLFHTKNSTVRFLGNTIIRTATDALRSPFSTDNGTFKIIGRLSLNSSPRFLRKLEGGSIFFKQLDQFQFTKNARNSMNSTSIQLKLSVRVADQYYGPTQCRTGTKESTKSTTTGSKRTRISTEMSLNCYSKADPSLTFGYGQADGHEKGQYGDCLCNAYQRAFSESGIDTVGCNKSVRAAQVCGIRNTTILVTSELDNDLSRLIVSKPSWLIFTGASSQCVKRTAMHWLFWKTSCTTSAYHSGANRQIIRSFLNISDVALRLLVETIRAERGSMTNMVLGGHLLLWPWSHSIGRAWDSTYHAEHTQPTGDKRIRLADVTLLVAPGESLSIHLTALDDVLSRVTTTLVVTVVSNHSRLLRFGIGSTYELIEDFHFTTNAAISGIALGGAVGSVGYLQFTMVDEPSTRSSTGAKFSLRLPFRLRNCHHGYLGPVTIKGDKISTFVCGCGQERYTGISRCAAGRHTYFKKGVWAGKIASPVAATNEDFHNVEPISLPLVSGNDSFEASTFYGESIIYPFSSMACQNGLCSDREWLYGVNSPCKFHGTGPLCGGCLNGTSLTIAESGCVDCKNRGVLNVYLHIFLTMLLTLLLFLVMFYFNFGLSPLLESWLFFIQTSWYVFPKSNPRVYGIFYSILTFGLGNLCPSTRLDRMQISAILLVQPMTLLLIFVSLRVARSYNRLGTLIARRTQHTYLVRVMYFAFVYSYFLLCFTAINMLWCDKLNGHLVLVMDGSIRCFQGDHIGYAVAAILILTVLVLLPPFILVLPQAQGNVYLKGFIDEASRIYGDRYRRWAAVGLLRRLAIALAGSLLGGDGVVRLLVMALVLLILLVSYHQARPFGDGTFARLSYNGWELLLLLLAFCNSILYVVAGLSAVYEAAIEVATLCLFYLPTLVLLLACAHRQCWSPQGGFGRIEHISLRKWWMRRAATSAELQESGRSPPPLNAAAYDNLMEEIREPLIADQIMLDQKNKK